MAFARPKTAPARMEISVPVLLLLLGRQRILTRKAHFFRVAWDNAHVLAAVFKKLARQMAKENLEIIGNQLRLANCPFHQERGEDRIFVVLDSHNFPEVPRDSA